MIGNKIETNIAGGLDFPLPRMVEVRQKFKTEKLASVTATINEEFKRPAIRAKIKPGMSVAVGCGSRGINNIAEAAKATVDNLKALGAKPFIFPAMGSHGGGTAEAQRGVLEGYGITEAYCGCEIRSSMDVIEVGDHPSGIPIYQDKLASEADGIVLVCRVKPHTNFRAPIESGHRQNDDYRHGQNHRRYQPSHARHGCVRHLAAGSGEDDHGEKQILVQHRDG